MYAMHFFGAFCHLFSTGRGLFVALSTAEHAGSPRVHYGTRAGPDRALLRVLRASQAARAGSFRGECVPRRRPAKHDGNPHKQNNSKHAHVPLFVAYRSSPDRLTTSHLAWCGRLVWSVRYLAPQPSSRLKLPRFEFVPSWYGAFVCMCSRITIGNVSQTAVQLGPKSHKLALSQKSCVPPRRAEQGY